MIQPQVKSEAVLQTSDMSDAEKGDKSADVYAQVVQDPAGLASLSADWDDLFERAGDAAPFLSRAWLNTFVEQGRFRGRVSAVAAWSDDKLVGLFVLAIRKFLSVTIATPVGTGQPGYLGVLADPAYASAVNRIAEALKKVADVICIEDLSSTDRVTNELLRCLSDDGYSLLQVERNICHRIRLGCSFDEYLEKSKTSDRRRKLRYDERKAFKSGNVEVVHYASGFVTPELNERVAAIQRDSWMAERGAAVLGRPFYQKLLMNMAKAGLAQVWLMQIAGEDAAFAYAFTAHKHLHYYWPAFKLKYRSSLSIGFVLLIQVVRAACEQGIEMFDFGHGDSEYKRYWTNESHTVSRVVMFRGSTGRVAALYFYALWRLGQVKWLRSGYHRCRKYARSCLGRIGK